MQPPVFLLSISVVCAVFWLVKDLLTLSRSRTHSLRPVKIRKIKMRLVVWACVIGLAASLLGVGDRTFAQTVEPPIIGVPINPEVLPIELLNRAELPAEPSEPAIAPTKQKGIAYVTWSTNGYTDYAAEQSLARLRATGADWISLLVTQYQDEITSTTIYSNSRTPTDAALTSAINRAHQLGLKVMLKPHLDLANDPTHWRGQIGQSFTAAEWQTWFEAYRAMITRYAQLAQTAGADQFTVGTELQTTEGQEAGWRNVISSVRDRYSGPITYASNWDNTSLAWWDAVDYIGIDAYVPLSNKNDPTVAELTAAWQPYMVDLADLAARWNKPILFTEIGYRSQDGANITPWEWQIGGVVDLQEQADCYQALFTAVFDQPWLAGIYLWSWAAEPEGGPADQGYTPRDKPAENILKQWYGRLN